MPGLSERQIQRAILRRLVALLPADAFWFHVANQTVAPREYVAALVGDGLKAGVPDLILIHRGRVFGIEVKRPGETLSDEQAAIHDRLERAGCRCVTLLHEAGAEMALGGWGLLDEAEAA
jgi:hypothetical protein